MTDEDIATIYRRLFACTTKGYTLRNKAKAMERFALVNGVTYTAVIHKNSVTHCLKYGDEIIMKLEVK